MIFRFCTWLCNHTLLALSQCQVSSRKHTVPRCWSLVTRTSPVSITWCFNTCMPMVNIYTRFHFLVHSLQIYNLNIVMLRVTILSHIYIYEKARNHYLHCNSVFQSTFNLSTLGVNFIFFIGVMGSFSWLTFQCCLNPFRLIEYFYIEIWMNEILISDYFEWEL